MSVLGWGITNKRSISRSYACANEVFCIQKLFVKVGSHSQVYWLKRIIINTIIVQWVVDNGGIKLIFIINHISNLDEKDLKVSLIFFSNVNACISFGKNFIIEFHILWFGLFYPRIILISSYAYSIGMHQCYCKSSIFSSCVIFLANVSS